MTRLILPSLAALICLSHAAVADEILTIGAPRLLTACCGRVHVSVTPSGFAVAVSPVGGIATGSGTITARFDG